jgi:transcriptional regulator with XRE-family HTH domain
MVDIGVSARISLDSFGTRFATARKRRGLSIAAVARHLKVSRSNVSKWERCDVPHNVGLSLIKAIYAAELLGVAVGWLVVGELGIEVIAVSCKLKQPEHAAHEISVLRRTVGRAIAR